MQKHVNIHLFFNIFFQLHDITANKPNSCSAYLLLHTIYLSYTNHASKQHCKINSFFFVDKPIVAYLHNLSPIKNSQRNNLYFDLSLQTSNSTNKSVCFSTEKHKQYKSKLESSSPMKLTNFNLKRNHTTNQLEVHINKRTKLEQPQTDEVDFDYHQSQPTEPDCPLTDIASITTSRNFKGLATVIRKVSFSGPPEDVLTKGKALRKL